MVCAMRDLNIGVFEHLETTSPLDVDKRVNYTQRLLRGPELMKYKSILEECKESKKGIDEYQWTLGAMKYVTMQQF